MTELLNTTNEVYSYRIIESRYNDFRPKYSIIDAWTSSEKMLVTNIIRTSYLHMYNATCESSLDPTKLTINFYNDHHIGIIRYDEDILYRIESYPVIKISFNGENVYRYRGFTMCKHDSNTYTIHNKSNVIIKTITLKNTNISAICFIDIVEKKALEEFYKFIDKLYADFECNKNK